MTPLNIINLAAKNAGVLGIGQSLRPEDANDILDIMNLMVAGWNRNRWLIDNEIDVSIPATGQQSYTVGPNGDFNTVRPDKLQAAYARLTYNGAPNLNPVDYPLNIIDAHEDYANISLKSLASYPMAVFYDSAYPLGNVYFYPIPNTNFELHLILKNTIGQFTLTQQINLPPEYQNALLWNTTARIFPMYGKQLDPEIAALASGALDDLITANTQLQLAKMPPGLPGMRRNRNRHTSGGYTGVIEGIATYDEDVWGP